MIAFSFVWVEVCLSDPRSIQFTLASSYSVHKRIVNRIKVYIERSNMQVELIRFRKNISPLIMFTLRSEEFNVARVFTLGKSFPHVHVR